MKRPVDITETAGGSVVVATFHGDIDMAEIPRIRMVLDASMAHAETGLVLDLNGVRHFDSSGLRLLFEMKKRLQQSGRRLSLVAPENGPVRRILSLVNIDQFITMRPTVAAALADFHAVAETPS
jgi:anti-anti-sigma factor